MENFAIYVVDIIFFIIFWSSLFSVGIILLKRGIEAKEKNFCLLGMSFITIGIGTFSGIIMNPDQYLMLIFNGFSFILIIIFTKLTFHKYVRNPGNILLILAVFLIIIQISIQYFINLELNIFLYNLRYASETIFCALTSFWLAFSAYNSYDALKDSDILPWVKIRYKLIYYSNSLIFLSTIPPFFLSIDGKLRFFSDLDIISVLVMSSIAIFVFFYSILIYLAWIMPNWFKSYVNKGYQPLEEKIYSKTEITELIKYLADCLAKKIHISSEAARGLIKLAIKDEIGAFKPLFQIKFGEFKKVINTSLKARISNMNIENLDSIITYIEEELKNSQSLITLAF